MALKRPGHATNVAANTAALQSDSKFFKVAKNTSEMVRFLPAPKEDGLIFYPSVNHYGLKNQDGRDIALACLGQHGDEESGTRCFICAAAAYFDGEDNEDMVDAIKGSRQNYAQVLRAVVENNKVTGWSKPKLLKLNQNGANNVMTILGNQQKFGTALATDPDKGQAIIITQTGEGFQSKYPAERTGEVVSLDEIRPTWVEEYMHDIYKEVGMDLQPPKVQLDYLRATYPAYDWVDIAEKTGFEDLVAE